MERHYELLLDTDKVVTWHGSDEFNAARRYVDTFPGAIVVATRPAPADIVVGCQTTD